jgi:hypothetical protein
MRKALNDNPVVQIGVLAALAVIVGFLLLTRMHGSSSSSSTSTTPTTPAPAGSTATAPTTGPAPTAPPASSTVPGTSTAPSAGSAGAVPEGKLVAGPGLPKSVANAYASGKAVVLLVVRNQGIDDGAVRASVERLRGHPALAVFVANAGHIARYSRIAEGVDVNRVPALIVVRPRSLTRGTPTASVSYGFRGPDGVVQAIRDALYKGPTNLPYYPR